MLLVEVALATRVELSVIVFVVREVVVVVVLTVIVVLKSRDKSPLTDQIFVVAAVGAKIPPTN